MNDVLHVDEPREGVRRWTLNRPGSLNAFDLALRGRLREEIARASADRDVKVVVLRGGGRAFSVGADVSRHASSDPAEQYLSDRSAAADFEALADNTVELFLDVWRMPVPVIAQVHGYCMGIATVLAHCCDMVFADTDTIFGWPRAPLGGGMIGPVWAYSTGAHLAKEFSLTVGARLSAQEAARYGVVNRVVAPAELEDTVLDIAGHTARLSRDLIRIKKAAINQVQARQGFEETVRAAAAWDALAHETDIVGVTREAIAERGLKQVLEDWRPPAREVDPW